MQFALKDMRVIGGKESSGVTRRAVWGFPRPKGKSRAMYRPIVKGARANHIMAWAHNQLNDFAPNTVVVLPRVKVYVEHPKRLLVNGSR